MAHHFTTSYLEDSISLFRQYKTLAKGAMVQITDDQLFLSLDPESNSIAIIVKHMAGNMRSRWTDFLKTDGEKPDRDRDSEFVDPPTSYWYGFAKSKTSFLLARTMLPSLRRTFGLLSIAILALVPGTACTQTNDT